MNMKENEHVLNGNAIFGHLIYVKHVRNDVLRQTQSIVNKMAAATFQFSIIPCKSNTRFIAVMAC